LINGEYLLTIDIPLVYQECVLHPIGILNQLRLVHDVVYTHLVHLLQLLALLDLVLTPAVVRHGYAVPLIEILRQVTVLHHKLLQDVYIKV
jgi:hypothetical protein